MITPHTDTIETTTREDGHTMHSVEITIRGDRRRVPCSVNYRADGTINLTMYGIALRFRTGTKVWPGSAVYWGRSGVVNNIRPNIDKFNGQFCQVLGYFEDYQQSKDRSQHNAVA